MARAESPLTPDIVRRLRGGVGLLLLSAVVLTVLLILPILFIAGEFGGGLISLIVLGVLCLPLAGLGKIRGALGDLEARMGGVPTPAPRREAPVREIIERPASEMFSEQTKEEKRRGKEIKNEDGELLMSSRPLFGGDAIRDLDEDLPATPRRERPATAPKSTMNSVDWEQWVGKKLLQKLGIVIVLIGMIVLLKYSFDNRIIGELGRLALGVLGAGALLFAGEWFQRKYRQWSQAFTGGGLALLYIVVWAARVLYAPALALNYGLIISPWMALGLYAFITLIGALAAIRYNAQSIAWFTMLGGFLTPLLVAANDPFPFGLAIYLLILSGGLLALAWYKRWNVLHIPCFLLTQMYLFTLVYREPLISDPLQFGIASVFFLLFASLPLIHQFRMKAPAKGDDLFLIVANGLATLFALNAAVGGWGDPAAAFVAFGLAAVYVLFAAAAISLRGTDAQLVNAYLVSGVALVTLGLYQQFHREWVAVAWAPFSALLAGVALFLRRRGALVCAFPILLGALLFLLLNSPAYPEGAAVWRPFFSNWALQSYVVFASVVAWVVALRRMPDALMGGENRHVVEQLGHTVLAVLLFVLVGIEVTGLQAVATLGLTYSYVFVALICLLAFWITGSLVWFGAAIIGQVLVLAFTFALGDGSGMIAPVLGGPAVTPFLHPWVGASAMAFVTTMAIMVVIIRKKDPRLQGPALKTLLIGTALAQVFAHFTVEIQHLAVSFAWTDLFAARVLSGWWILFALALLAYGEWRKIGKFSTSGLALLFLPLLKDILFQTGVQGRYELALWMALPAALVFFGDRRASSNILRTGLILLCVWMAKNALQSFQATGLLESVLWTGLPLVMALYGDVRGSQEIRRTGLALLAVWMMRDLVHLMQGGAGMYETVLWAIIPMGIAWIGAHRKSADLLQGGLSILGIWMAVDMLTHLGIGNVYDVWSSPLLRTLWTALVALTLMIAGFAERRSLLRRASIAIFAATVIKLLVFDFSFLSTGVRIVASIGTGLLMIGASYLYQRFDSATADSR